MASTLSVYGKFHRDAHFRTAGDPCRPPVHLPQSSSWTLHLSCRAANTLSAASAVAKQSRPPRTPNYQERRAPSSNRSHLPSKSFTCKWPRRGASRCRSSRGRVPGRAPRRCGLCPPYTGGSRCLHLWQSSRRTGDISRTHSHPNVVKKKPDLVKSVRYISFSPCDNTLILKGIT